LLVVPHCLPSSAQFLGTQGTQTFAVPVVSQRSFGWQLPQFRVPPQPSGTLPQVAPAPAQVSGVQHCPFRQTWFVAQLPQLIEPPQRLLWSPHTAPIAWQVTGVHGEQMFAVPPPPQSWPVGHAPQSI
jgi:hypothetical protein